MRDASSRGSVLHMVKQGPYRSTHARSAEPIGPACLRPQELRCEPIVQSGESPYPLVKQSEAPHVSPKMG